MLQKQMADDFNITFWGVRGTMPTPQPENLRYGGHTSCVEMNCGGRRLIFDAGTGLYPLGEDETLTDIDLFLSHTHIDHIMGLPFFSPAFRQGTQLRIWAGHLKKQGLILREVIDRIFTPPIFPLRIEDLKSDMTFHDFEAGQTLDIPHINGADITIKTLPLNHPDEATGYRVEYTGKSACYITDIEHLRDGSNEALLSFIAGADLLIYDCTFDDRDFERFVGWGHSTWQEAVRLSDKAGVKKLALFHHDPGRSDEALDEINKELHALRPGDIVAKQKQTVTL